MEFRGSIYLGWLRFAKHTFNQERKAFFKKEIAANKMSSEEYLFTLVGDIQSKELEHGFASLTQKEQVFFCVWSIEAEVNNGGFNQYFFNSAGDHASETVEALRAIGAEHTASLLERAIAVFGAGGPSSERDRRQDQLERLSEEQRAELSELDDAFFAYEDNLSELLARYMQA